MCKMNVYLDGKPHFLYSVSGNRKNLANISLVNSLSLSLSLYSYVLVTK